MSFPKVYSACGKIKSGALALSLFVFCCIAFVLWAELQVQSPSSLTAKAMLAFKRRDYACAQRYWRLANVSENDLRFAMIANGYGEMLLTLGCPREAEPFLQKALRAVTTILGPNDAQTLICQQNLACAYGALERYSEAEAVFLSVLNRTRRSNDYRATATVMNNLALDYRHQGCWGKAENTLRESLRLCKEHSNSNDIETLKIEQNLADLLEFRGHYSEAEKLAFEVVTKRNSLLGANVDTAASISTLAKIYQDQKKFDTAEELFWKVLKIRKKVLGSADPATIASVNNLGILLYAKGHVERAAKLLDDSSASYKSLYGERDERTRIAMSNLALAKESLGQYVEAENILKRNLSFENDFTGVQELDKASTMTIMADVYAKQGRVGDAQAFYTKSVDIQRRILGAHHPETLQTTDALASLQTVDRIGTNDSK